MSFIVGAPM